MSKNWNPPSFTSSQNDNKLDDNSSNAALPPSSATTEINNNDRSSSSSSNDNQNRLLFTTTASTRGRRSLFPGKLRRLLKDSETEGNQHIVSWMPHGKAFRVHRPKEFASQIVGRYFNHGQYTSFTRQLYHYGFGKVDCGDDMGAFYHPQFLRDHPALDYLIGRRKDSTSKKTSQRSDQVKSSSAPSVRGGTGEKTSTAGNTSSGTSSITIQHQQQQQLPQQVSSFRQGNSIGMLESPIQSLMSDASLRIDRSTSRSSSNEAHQTAPGIGMGYYLGRGGFLNRLSTTTAGNQRNDMFKNFQSDDDTKGGNWAKKPEGIDFQRSNFDDDSASLGQLFGDDEGDDILDNIVHLFSPSQSQGEAASAASWFGSISDYFDNHSFDDDMFGADFEPRPVEEMALLSYNLSRDMDDDK